ncbi:MAG: hypothetical protein QWI36_04140 [Wolbachia endosymbiont of Tyrophagus putrescentiae]|nr:hypothetical protein [Wolbachia endosymbiont of Tyrophagus putrescentiae]
MSNEVAKLIMYNTIPNVIVNLVELPVVGGFGSVSGVILAFTAAATSNLSPFVSGGVIGAGSQLLEPLFSSLCLSQLRIVEENKSHSCISETKRIVDLGVAFGVGAYLTTFGVRRPAAIGALSVIAPKVVSIAFTSACLAIGGIVSGISTGIASLRNRIIERSESQSRLNHVSTTKYNGNSIESFV